jgi:hypothetical protein
MSRRYWIFYGILGALWLGAASVVSLEIKYGLFHFDPAHWLSLATITGVVTGWAITSLVTLYSARRQHTISVLLQSRLSPAYQQRLRDITAAYPTLPRVTRVALGDWNDPDKVAGLEAVKYLLNYFEFVAVGIRVGDLDEKTIRSCLENVVFTLTDMASVYIQFCRGELNVNDGFPSNDAFGEILALRDRWYRA